MKKNIDGLMTDAVSGNVFPGGILLVSVDGAVVFFEAYGVENLFSGNPVTKETIFDLASLTKPLATTLAVMKLVQGSDLTLNQTLGSILPSFKNTDKKNIRIEQLLYHNSGLPDYRPYYKRLQNLDPGKRKDALRDLLVKEPLVNPPGSKVVYSDLGFMVLCWVVETVSGIRLDHFVMENIYRPLNLKALFFAPVGQKRPQGRFAATEKCPWRGILLEGVVHDDNAYSVGGIEGHAGLFGTAGNVFYLLSDLLAGYGEDDGAKLFDSELIRRFFRRNKHTGRAMGFDTPSSIGASCGRFFSKKTVGHLGFTGTSFWMDLERNMMVILFTNRIHPSRDNNRIKVFRPILHDAVMEKYIIGKSL
jgi:serine-type D-Ala-D-Ala carboxypeptidase